MGMLSVFFFDALQIVDGDLETYFETSPFESYPVYRGKAVANGKRAAVKEAGRLKVSPLQTGRCRTRLVRHCDC